MLPFFYKGGHMNKYFVAMAPPQVLALTIPLEVGRGLITPGLTQSTRQMLAVRVQKNGKFVKNTVFYMPYSLIPPLAYSYQCANCTFYQSAGKTCECVQDIVEPYAYCGLWLPMVNEPANEWGEDLTLPRPITPAITELQGV
jgi:hypothetical protein